MNDRQRDRLTLWYRSPADNWREVLPVGNGRMGAAAFGGVHEETIRLNEDTVWSGYSRWNGVNNAAERFLPELRRLILQEKDYYRAEEIAERMQGPFSESYLALGSLHLTMGHRGGCSDYRRELELACGMQRVAYTLEGTRYTREIFASVPDDVVVLRFEADRPGMISFTGRLESFMRPRFQGFAYRYGMKGSCPRHVAPDYLEYRDKVSNHPIVYDEEWEGKKGLRYECHVQIEADNGVVRANEQGFSVCGADAVSLLIWAGTDFERFDRQPDRSRDIEGRAGRVLQAAAHVPYAQLRERHAMEHRALFDRVRLVLGEEQADDDASTGERLNRYKEGTPDPGLEALYFQYGRYLLMGSSRPGTQAANLQGIWSWQMRPPWSGNYTTNINVQMNYWMAESANLTECHEPFLQLLEEIAEAGRETADNLYGARGWVAHHNLDLWRNTAPIGRGESDSKWAMWPMGGVWICQHLWERYLYTRDEEFLRRRAYPVLREAARFILDFLTDDGAGGLTTCPSTVPEERFRLPNGRTFSVGAGAALDMELIADLFQAVEDAAALLRNGDAIIEEIALARDKLPQLFPVNEGGLLQDWQQDVQSGALPNVLYGLYPGRLMSPLRTPELMNAARRTLLSRGRRFIGFPAAWYSCMWARMEENERAYEQYRFLLTDVSHPNMWGKNGENTFQIDANLGASAALIEMLLQSHDNRLRLLPALPRAWSSGEVRGLRARGGFEVAMRWREGRLTAAVLRSGQSGPCTIGGIGRLPLWRVESATKDRASTCRSEVPALREGDGSVSFAAEAGAAYVIGEEEANGL